MLRKRNESKEIYQRQNFVDAFTVTLAVNKVSYHYWIEGYNLLKKELKAGILDIILLKRLALALVNAKLNFNETAEIKNKRSKLLELIPFLNNEEWQKGEITNDKFQEVDLDRKEKPKKR